MFTLMIIPNFKGKRNELAQSLFLTLMLDSIIVLFTLNI
jgi:hypothetical protein